MWLLVNVLFPQVTPTPVYGQAFFISYLDYHNSLLTCLPDSVLICSQSTYPNYTRGSYLKCKTDLAISKTETIQWPSIALQIKSRFHNMLLMVLLLTSFYCFALLPHHSLLSLACSLCLACPLLNYRMEGRAQVVNSRCAGP